MQRSRLSWRHLVILLVVLAISANLATRTFHLSFIHPTVQAHATQAKHQHLDADAFGVTRPLSHLTMLPATGGDSRTSA
jgi:hypothetical protein